MPFGLLLDLWECHKQYNGQATPARAHYIDDIIPDGIEGGDGEWQIVSD